mmetsp:Transcript_4559/g.13546  ORF Transcript_4559/g.13546 Transcript_4559/m.13546 type:complete len:333 (+) Transcript_4559:1877-2875(+)
MQVRQAWALEVHPGLRHQIVVDVQSRRKAAEERVVGVGVPEELAPPQSVQGLSSSGAGSPSRHGPEHDVGIRALKGECADAVGTCSLLRGGAAGNGNGLPRRHEGHPVLALKRVVQVRIQRPEVNERCCGGPGRDSNGLDDAVEPRGRFRMACGALDARKEQDPAGCRSRVIIKDTAEGTDFDGIAQQGPRAVHLDALHVKGVEAGVFQGQVEHLLLGGTARGRQGGGPPVLVHRSAKDSHNAIARRGGFPGQEGGLDGLRPRVPVRRGVEGLAPPVRGQHPRTHHDLEPLVRLVAVRAAGEGLLNCARGGVQSLPAQVQSKQGGRARGIDA